EKILILEADSSCGGTWSRDRLYPGLKSNNLRGSYEYPDFPMSEDVYGVQDGQHIPAAVLHRYLTDFARQFGVLARTRFNTRVDALQAKKDHTWDVHISPSSGCHSPETGSPEVLPAKKIIIATGLTSRPNIPSYPGQETLTSTFFHAKEFCHRSDTVDSCENAVVIGAGKSAFDCAYAFATEGSKAQVQLVIRPTGQGPVWLCPPYVTPFKRAMEELLNTRLLTWFSPCPWGGEDGFGLARGFLHGTAVGRFLTRNFWAALSSEVVESHGYNDHPELFKLKPWQSAFWTGSGVGIHNYPTNFFDLVKQGKISVHVADVASVGGTSIHLTDGSTLDDVDVVVCATGWTKESTIRFIDCEPSSCITRLPASDKQALLSAADSSILSAFPILKDQPVLRHHTAAPAAAAATTSRKQKKHGREPFRNYRFIVPPDHVPHRNIAYAGMVSTVSTAMFANAQALWIAAFFDGKLRRGPKTQEEVTKEVLLHTEFGKWRYPCGYGAELPDFAFDSLPYVDLLLNDLGLKPHRKATQLMELTEPYKPWDYKGLVDEWLAGQGE
ncbi:hypothetical protein QQS21_008394, partial [Conoideocrella luteorostrata]